MPPKKKSRLQTILSKLAEKGIPLEEMAKEVGLESRAVLFWLDAFGLKTKDLPPQIVAKAREKGFDSLASYFRENGSKTFQTMSEDLGVSHCTIEVYYRIFSVGVGG